MASPFVPKQAIAFDGALLKELQGDISDKIALALLKDLGLSRMPPSSVIHDNGCGYGAVTMAVMASDPPKDVQVHATDVNPMFMAELKTTLTRNPSWRVKTDTMDACALTFPDNTFDLSMTTFVLAGLPNAAAALSHIRRTLKPGGVGVAATRGTDEPLAPFLVMPNYKKAEVARDAEAAGWGLKNENEIEWTEKAEWVILGADLKRWVTIGWSFFAKPGGEEGWRQRDEDRWDEAVDAVVEELRQGPWHKVEEGVHKIRMVADVAIMRKRG
ncbi:hypothetical protein PG990_008735 [Apiospora arundinis]